MEEEDFEGVAMTTYGEKDEGDGDEEKIAVDDPNPVLIEGANNQHNQHKAPHRLYQQSSGATAAKSRFTVDRVPLKISPYCTLGPTAVRSPSVVRFYEQATVNSCLGLLMNQHSSSNHNIPKNSSHTYGYAQARVPLHLHRFSRRPSITGGPLPQPPASSSNHGSSRLLSNANNNVDTGKTDSITAAAAAAAAVPLLGDEQEELKLGDDFPVLTLQCEEEEMSVDIDAYGDLCLLCPRKHIEGEIYEWLLPESSVLHSQRLPCDCAYMRYVHVECLDRMHHSDNCKLVCPWCEVEMLVHRQRVILCQPRKLCRHSLELAIVLSIFLVFILWSLIKNGLQPLNGSMLSLCLLAVGVFLVLKLRSICRNYNYNISRPKVKRKTSSVITEHLEDPN